MDKSVIIAIIITGIGYILGILTPWLKAKVAKTETKVDDYVLDIVLGAVEFAETKFGAKSGANKKIIAKTLIENKLGNAVKDIDVASLIDKVVTNKNIEEMKKEELKEELINSERNKEQLVPTDKEVEMGK